MTVQPHIDRLIGWHILVAPQPGRKVYLRGLPEGASARWAAHRGEILVQDPAAADLHVYWDQMPPRTIETASWIVVGMGRTHLPPGARCYALIPPGDPRLALPLGNRKQLLRGLAMHRPGRRVARITVTILGILARLGITQPLKRRTLCISPDLAPPADIGLDPVLYLGATDICRKTTILPCRGDVIMKYGTGFSPEAALQNEAETLLTLKGSLISDRIPRLVSSRKTSLGMFLEQEYRAPLRVGGRPTEAVVIRFLAELATIGVENRSGIMGHRCHGDFAPWNMMQTRQGVFVYDWEDSRPWAPVLTDAFYHVTAPFIYVPGLGNAATAEARALAFAAKVARTIGLEKHLIEPLWHNWLVERNETKPSDFVSQLLRRVEARTRLGMSIE